MEVGVRAWALSGRRPWRTGPVVMVAVLFTLLVGLPMADGYDCIEKCNFNDESAPIVAQSIDDDHCLIRIPDNPVRMGNRTYPCQLEIMSNCTTYCHIHLTFTKLNLQLCPNNVSADHFYCDDLHNCEYVVLKEQGLDENGVEISQVTRFHGDLTEDTYESLTDRVVLQFCYRSETFSARNIQIEYRVVDPLIIEPLNTGPPSVYVLGSIVILLLVAIVMIRWSPWLKPCLDPPPQKQNVNLDF